MKYKQNWRGAAVINGKYSAFFDVNVPGNIQKDYGAFMGWGDWNWMDNCRKYEQIEDYFWSYQTDIFYQKQENERVFFVTEGIEYEYDIKLNGKKLLHHEGMFTKVELDITDQLKTRNHLEVLIYPHPMLEGEEMSAQARQSVKPSVCYGYDWHPRMIISGIWNETYIETRGSNFIRDVEASYTLSNDLTEADIHFEIDCHGETQIELCDIEGNILYKGVDPNVHLKNIQLWWCRGQGKPYLYNYTVTSKENQVSGKIGFKKVKLVMNENAWKDDSWPVTRAPVPITVELNGRKIFGKGSNWVIPEIFTATISEQTYRTQLQYAIDANMNMLRAWGGAIVNREVFFDICDELGLMVWQEFPLSCNNHRGTSQYLNVLEAEARAIVRRVRRHACHIMWCGGNELFNYWSKMTDQSHALRLLNKICYEEDFAKPFLITSPAYGMTHGYYQFYDSCSGKTVYQLFADKRSTAYTEFATPSLASIEQLNHIFDKETLHNPSDEPNSPWYLHHAFRAWSPNSWACFDILDMVFGIQPSIVDYVEKSNILQCASLKCCFEEARRQKPECSMALNWDFNEPWRSAAGNNLIAYPDERKPAYYAVQSSLQDVVPSASVKSFSYKPGDVLQAELWLLNDTPYPVEDTVEVYFTVDGKQEHIDTWHTGVSEPNRNINGHSVSITIPDSKTQFMTLTLQAKCATNEYTFFLDNSLKVIQKL